MTDAEILALVRESCHCGRAPLGKPCARCAGNGARVVAEMASLRRRAEEAERERDALRKALEGLEAAIAMEPFGIKLGLLIRDRATAVEAHSGFNPAVNYREWATRIEGAVTEARRALAGGEE